jgi:hypothetical protein
MASDALALLRYVGGCTVSGLALGLGFLWLGWDTRKPGRTEAPMLVSSIRLVLCALVLTALIVAPSSAFAQSAPAVEELPLADAVARGLAQVSGSGAGLDRLDLSIQSLHAAPLRIVVSAGTIFAPSSNVQRMMVTKSQAIVVPAGGTRAASVAAACIDASLDTPGSGDRFALASFAEGPLGALARAPGFGDAPWRARQYAVWIVRENPASADELPEVGDFVTSGPSSAEVATACDLIAAAGLDRRAYRVCR